MRLIDADKLLDRLPKVDLDHDEKITRSGAIMDMICMVETAPTVEMPRWIPVTERVPEDDYVPGGKTFQIKVMVCNVNNGSRSIRTLTRCWDRWLSIDGNVREWKWRWAWSKNVRDNEITHWMPISMLPEVE